MDPCKVREVGSIPTASTTLLKRQHWGSDSLFHDQIFERIFSLVSATDQLEGVAQCA